MPRAAAKAKPAEAAQPQQSTAVAVRTETAVAEPRAIDRVREALELRMSDIAQILPPSMDAARFLRVSLLAVSRNPDILECDRQSIIVAILDAAEVGLEPTGGVGGAHLVPFKDKAGKKHAQLIYDYRGVQFLIREGGGGEVKTVLVYEGDDFDVYEGTQPRIEHRPKYETADPSKITYVYAWPLDHPDKFEVMTKVQVDAVRARSKAANNGPWVTDYGPQARKTVLKRISAWLPLKPSAITKTGLTARDLLERDTQREINVPVPAVVVASRTAEVRDRVLNRGKKAFEPVGTTETPADPEAAAMSAPGASAVQQPPTAEQGAIATEAAVAGEAVCGATSDPKLGELETCVLPPDHLAVKDSAQRHQGASGSVWPS